MNDVEACYRAPLAWCTPTWPVVPAGSRIYISTPPKADRLSFESTHRDRSRQPTPSELQIRTDEMDPIAD